ncbi:MAG: TetR family transcriptional regulator [Phycisphaerales bacterium]|nr:TetR family transcriptional regulator [Phycisphaerales bacterium]
METQIKAATRARGQATRHDLMNIARRLFSEHGFSGTALADIQQASGLTKGAFYHHFRSKEDMALALLESARAEYERRLIAPAMAAGTPGKRLVALLDGVLALNRQPEWCNCQMMLTLCGELNAGRQRLRDAVLTMQNDFVDMWRELIIQAQETGEVAPGVEPAVWAQWIMNTFHGLFLAKKLGCLNIAPEKIIGLIKGHLLVGGAAPRCTGRSE